MADAEASSATRCADDAFEHRAAAAAYYELNLALVNGTVYEWKWGRRPRVALEGAVHVAVSESRGYAIDAQRRVLGWDVGSDRTEILLDDATLISAGNSGLLAIRRDGSLWQRKARSPEWSRIADAAVHAWVGDGADYYVDADGRLFVHGKADRGQYGNGRLAASEDWVHVSDGASFVVAHTGHALYLTRDGRVMGTGGNRYGPLGTHGYGDKATVWGILFEGGRRIATGARHSLAIRPDGELWIWGSGEGLAPKRILGGVLAVSGGLDESVAITADGAVWNWRVGQPPARIELPA